ncbi:hypothetical protein BD769DRAFT_1389583 [Suillus cothurnatus]|nr:hypothetical protein BD769DRAFT_1389583 [Suillus cothurnatus]
MPTMMIMSDSSATTSLLMDDMSTLSAFQSAHYLEIACFTLLVYDLLTTFGEEVEYFWSGSINCRSRVVLKFTWSRTFKTNECWCTHWIRAAFELSIITICINQGILFLRVWYMYSHNALARAVACFSYAGCALSSLILMGLSLPFLESTTESLQLQRKITAIPGCSAPAPSMIWTIFVPSTIIHIILFVFTIARVMKISRDLRMDQLMLRLVRDGGLVFFVSMDKRASNMVKLAISAVAVSRLMLSIRSLAGKLKISQDWLFNPSELSRVRWRAVSGNHGRIIVVEMDSHEPVSQKV